MNKEDWAALTICLVIILAIGGMFYLGAKPGATAEVVSIMTYQGAADISRQGFGGSVGQTADIVYYNLTLSYIAYGNGIHYLIVACSDFHPGSIIKSGDLGKQFWSNNPTTPYWILPVGCPVND